VRGPAGHVDSQRQFLHVLLLARRHQWRQAPGEEDVPDIR
jgi:hypothetical protein